MTSAQEWSGIIVEKFIEFLEFLFVAQYNLQLLTSIGAKNMVAAVRCSLQSKVLNSKMK
jgi:ABC-type siderophore export system fused ATPase/permease subunit